MCVQALAQQRDRFDLRPHWHAGLQREGIGRTARDARTQRCASRLQPYQGEGLDRRRPASGEHAGEHTAVRGAEGRDTAVLRRRIIGHGVLREGEGGAGGQTEHFLFLGE